MSDLDKSAGQRALGPDQTVSGKVQSTLKEAHTRVKSVDEHKGYSKVAYEVSPRSLFLPFLAHRVLVLLESPCFALRPVCLVLLHQHF